MTDEHDIELGHEVAVLGPPSLLLGVYALLAPGVMVYADDCEAPQLEACLPIALRCQKERRGITFEKRSAAERACVYDALKRL